MAFVGPAIPTQTTSHRDVAAVDAFLAATARDAAPARRSAGAAGRPGIGSRLHGSGFLPERALEQRKGTLKNANAGTGEEYNRRAKEERATLRRERGRVFS